VLSPETVLAGRYRILSILGEGRFGKVYLGYDLRIDRHVAIKELLPHSTVLSTEEWQDYRTRFRKEAQTASRFIHANVVCAYGLEIDDDETIYLVLEHVDGKSLRQLLETESPLQVERALDIAIDICQAIEAISLRDIVHRDVKPGNILLTSQGVAKLTGFGVAQLGHEIHRTQPPLGHPGTPAYKSPEQAISTGCLDQRSDLYSLGLVMYEMLAGRRYQGDGRPPRHYNGDIPHALDAAVMKALAESPAARYQTAGEMRRDLAWVRDQSTWGQLRVVLTRVCSRHNASIAAIALVVGLALSIFRLSAAVPRPVEADRRAVYAAQVPLEATATYPWTATPSMTPRPPAEREALPSITPTVAGLRDVYEPDDKLPAPISVGETQRRVFDPVGDVDRVTFRAKAGRTYIVTTANLGIGVDTSLEVLVGGERIANDDVSPGTLASQVAFTPGEDGTAVVTVHNEDQFGPDRTYDLSLIMTLPTQTPVPSPTPSPTPTATRITEATTTPRPTFTPRPTRTRTPTRPRTPTRTRTPSRTPTRTRPPTATLTPTVTDTSPPTSTPTSTKTPTPDRSPLPVRTPGPPVK